MRHLVRSLALLATLLLCFATFSFSQHQSITEKLQGQSKTNVMVRSGTVVQVDGENLFVRMEDGQVKHFVPPPDAKFTVDGKELSLSELQPGTKLTQSVTTTTTPTVVRTTTKIKGTVFHVVPPTSVILRLADGTNRQYFIPQGQKLNVDGREMDAFALKKGMKIDATVTKEIPEEVVSTEKAVVGAAPAAEQPPAPTETASATAPQQPEAAAAATPQSETAPASQEQQAALPQTASPAPLLLLLGSFSTLAGWMMRRKH